MANGKELVPHVGAVLSASLNNHIGLLKHCSLLDLKYLISHKHIPQSHCNTRLFVFLILCNQLEAFDIDHSLEYEYC